MIIRTKEALLKYLSEFDAERFTFDTETAGWYGSALQYDNIQLVAIALYDGVLSPATVEFNFKATYEVKEQDPDNKRRKVSVVKEYFYEDALEWDDVKDTIIELFNGAKVTCHNGKYDMKVAHKYGFWNFELEHDTMVMSYCDDCTTFNGLKETVKRELGIKMTTFEEAVGMKPSNIVWPDVNMNVLANYACDDVLYTHQLREHFLPRLKQKKVLYSYQQIEMPLVPVVTCMELRGVCIDVPVLEEISDRLRKRIAEVEEIIFDKCGVEFNISSNKQLGEILFERLGYPIIATTAKGAPQVNDAVMKELSYMGYEVADDLSEYSKLNKLLGTYAEGIPKMVAADGRLHGTLNQIGTETGRFSSSGPNLQNQPNNDEFPIREAFVATPGYGLIVGDWSTIEIRVMAHESQDEVLMDILREGRDIHQETTDKINSLTGLNLKRGDGKTINFAILYRMGPESLMNSLNTGMKTQVRKGKMTEEEYHARKLTKDDAKGIIDGFKQAYRGFARWSYQCEQNARAIREVRTFTGRRRPMVHFGTQAEWKSVNQVVNTKIQGGAGELMKRALILIPEMFKEKGYEAHLLLTVHDEVVIECRLDQIHACRRDVQHLMENIMPSCSVPILAEVGCFTTWAGMKTSKGGGEIIEPTFLEDVLNGKLGNLIEW
jgi:DNA polymerase I